MKTEYLTGALVGAVAVGAVSWFAWSRHLATMQAGAAYSPPPGASGSSGGTLLLGQTLGDFIDSARTFFQQSPADDAAEP